MTSYGLLREPTDRPAIHLYRPSGRRRKPVMSTLPKTGPLFTGFWGRGRREGDRFTSLQFLGSPVSVRRVRIPESWLRYPAGSTANKSAHSVTAPSALRL